jgi:hypothetical protein
MVAATRRSVRRTSTGAARGRKPIKRSGFHVRLPPRRVGDERYRLARGCHCAAAHASDCHLAWSGAESAHNSVRTKTALAVSSREKRWSATWCVWLTEPALGDCHPTGANSGGRDLAHLGARRQERSLGMTRDHVLVMAHRCSHRHRRTTSALEHGPMPQNSAKPKPRLACPRRQRVACRVCEPGQDR